MAHRTRTVVSVLALVALASSLSVASTNPALAGPFPIPPIPTIPPIPKFPPIHGGTYEVGLFGDMPYGDYGRAKYPNLIEDMNRTNLAFSVFDGDIKNGSEPCYADAHTPTDKTTPEMAVADPAHPDIYKYALNLFGQFRDPVVVVPGDNEWTDCDRPAIVATSDSNDRLAYERRLFYPSNNSLGQRTIQQIRQSAAYPENVRWSQGPVTFIGLNIPGSDNNFADGGKNGPAAQGQAEYAARNAANLDWLRAGFAAAKAAHSRPACMPSRRRA
jgi:hypothetical protein